MFKREMHTGRRRQDKGDRKGLKAASWNIFASQLGPLCADVFIGTRGRGRWSDVKHISKAADYFSA